MAKRCWECKNTVWHREWCKQKEICPGCAYRDARWDTGLCNPCSEEEGLAAIPDNRAVKI